MKVSTIKEQGNKVIESISEPASPSEGTLWLDLNNTNIHPVINSGNLVEKKVIAADCSSVTFTGLDSLTDGDYYLEANLISVSTSKALNCFVNDDETLSNYKYIVEQIDHGASSVTIGYEDKAYSIAVYSQGAQCSMKLSVVNGYFFFTTHTSKLGSNIFGTRKRCGSKISGTISSINKIKFVTEDNTVQIKAGSVFTLYKQNSAQQLVPYNPIDISSRTSDYYLKPGEIVYIDFTNATTAPLNIATVEGEYELTIIGNGTNTTYTASPTYLRPNNTTYGNAFSYLEYGKEISTSDAGGSKTLDSYGTGSHPGIQIAYQQLLKCNYIITTYTTAKCITGSHIRKSSATAHVFFRNHVIWENTTTPWTSLGTIAFPFAHSGKIIIKRII